MGVVALRAVGPALLDSLSGSDFVRVLGQLFQQREQRFRKSDVRGIQRVRVVRGHEGFRCEMCVCGEDGSCQGIVSRSIRSDWSSNNHILDPPEDAGPYSGNRSCYLSSIRPSTLIGTSI